MSTACGRRPDQLRSRLDHAYRTPRQVIPSGALREKSIERGSQCEGSDDAVKADPVRLPKMASLVAAKLRRQIVNGELIEGDALPPEEALMETFGVSRPTLREAFRVLESEQLITVRRGVHGGARVHLPSEDVSARYAALILEHRKTTVQDVHRARTVIELACVQTLAEKRRRNDVRQLRKRLREATELRGEPLKEVVAQTEFHTEIVHLAGIQTLELLFAMLRKIIHTATYSGAAAGGTRSEARIRRASRAHEQLVDLIENGDAEGAEALWRKHLEASEDFLTGSDSRLTVLELME